jgi:hypothetical protein
MPSWCSSMLDAKDFKPVPGEPNQWVDNTGFFICGKQGQSLHDLIAELNRDEQEINNERN